MTFSRHAPNAAAWVGIVIVTVFVLAAVFAPWVAPYGQADSIGTTWQPPSPSNWLGTDNIGRDMLSRVIYGARISIGVALVSTILSFVFGITSGLVAAVSAKWIDRVLSSFVDIILAIPLLIWASMVLALLGSDMIYLILTIAVLDSTRVFRLARSIALGLKSMDFVEAARLRGEGLAWIVRREILPNALPPLISEFGLRFCFNFLFVAGLSFLGLGIQPPLADWGGMVRDNGKAIYGGGLAPIWPALAIAVMTIGVNLIVDWILSMNARPSGASAEM